MKCPECNGENFIKSRHKDVSFMGYTEKNESKEVTRTINLEACFDCGYENIYQ